MAHAYIIMLAQEQHPELCTILHTHTRQTSITLYNLEISVTVFPIVPHLHWRPLIGVNESLNEREPGTSGCMISSFPIACKESTRPRGAHTHMNPAAQVQAAEQAYTARLEAERVEREAQQQRQAAAERLRMLEVEEQRQAEATAIAQEREAITAVAHEGMPVAGLGDNGTVLSPVPADPGPDASAPVEAGPQGPEHKRKQLRAIELRVCCGLTKLVVTRAGID